MKNQLVINYKEQVSTTSRLIAKKFEIEHKDVLKAINKLECSPEFRERNFTPSSYKSQQNKELAEYIVTRDGFVLLAMAFTGAKAIKFKEEYIMAFNEMEVYIRSQTPINLILTYTNRILSEPTKEVPDGYWSVFDECHSIMFLVETHIGSQDSYDLLDGSIGRLWSSFRKGQPWAKDNSEYPHEFADNRGVRISKCYDDSEIPYFRKWLKRIYREKHLYTYLENKYIKEKNVLMLAKVREAMPKLLGKRNKAA